MTARSARRRFEHKAFLLAAGIAVATFVWLIADQMTKPTVEPSSEALDIQLQAAAISIAKVWNATVRSWDAPPQDLCISADPSPDIAAAENYRVLPPRTIKSIQDAVGPGITVRPMNDCGLTGTVYGVVTHEGHRAWIIEYYDADAELLMEKHRGKDDRWSDRDDFNTNRSREDDATVQVSNGYMWDDYHFDFKSLQGKVRIAHARKSLNLQ